MPKIVLSKIVNIVNSILQHHKSRLLIYGVNPIALQLCSDLAYFNITVDYFLDDNPSTGAVMGKKVREATELLYDDNIDDCYILVALENKEYKTETIPHLRNCGVKAVNTLLAYESPLQPIKYLLDFTLGHTIEPLDIEGFDIYGDRNNQNSLKIVTLGNSTTHSRYARNIRCWSFYLYNYLLNKGYDITVLCGGITAYQSYQELCKLIRDVIPLKPDIVLSYSGYTDFADLKLHPNMPEQLRECYCQRPYQIRPLNMVRRFKDVCAFGLQNNLSYVDTWLNNQIMMHAIAAQFKIHYLGFLQPYLYSGNYAASEDELFLSGSEFFRDCLSACYAEIQEKIKAYDFLIDYSGIFDGYREIYHDICHVFDKGNKIIANAVLSDLESRQLLGR